MALWVPVTPATLATAVRIQSIIFPDITFRPITTPVVRSRATAIVLRALFDTGWVLVRIRFAERRHSTLAFVFEEVRCEGQRRSCAFFSSRDSGSFLPARDRERIGN